MKRLLLMRHAKSVRDDASLPDDQRPLNERGQKTAPLMGKFLAEQGCLPELILCSSALRAVQTGERLLQGTGKKIRLGLDNGLYKADVEQFCDCVGDGADSERTVMVISHNPGLERWIYALTGKYESMPTAAVALVGLSDKMDWSELNCLTKGELHNLWRPREVLSEDLGD